MTILGRGWLTVNVGAVRPRNNGVLEGCDAQSDESAYCDPFVKLAAQPFDEDELQKFETDTKMNEPGWATFDDTFRFKKMDKQSLVHSEIYDYNRGWTAHEQVFDINVSAESMLDRYLYKNQLSQLIMVSIWRDETTNEEFVPKSK